MIAHHGAELAQLAETNGVHLLFEFRLWGIPAVKTLREGLAGNKITRVAGILNGTLTTFYRQWKPLGVILKQC